MFDKSPEIPDSPFVGLVRREQRRVSAAAWALADVGLTVKGVVEGSQSIYDSGDYTMAAASGLSTFGSIIGFVFGKRADEVTIPCWLVAGGTWAMAGAHTHQYGLAALGVSCVIGQFGANNTDIAKFLREDRPTQRLIETLKKTDFPEMANKYLRSLLLQRFRWAF